MKVNCSFGVLPLVYPINVEFAYISWFCLQKGNYIIHWDKMGLVLRVYWNQPESFWNTYTTIFTCCLLSWNELCSAGEAQCCWLNTSIKKEAKQICFQGFPHPVLSIYLEMALDQVQEWYKWSSYLYYVVSISKTASAFNSSYLRGCAVGIIIPILQISVYLIFIHVCPCGISLFSSEDYRHWCTVTVFFLNGPYCFSERVVVWPWGWAYQSHQSHLCLAVVSAIHLPSSSLLGSSWVSMCYWYWAEFKVKEVHRIRTIYSSIQA